MSDSILAVSTPSPVRVARPGGEPAVKRILIVDDEETIRLALSKFLRLRGYDVRAVGSGPEALEVLAREQFMVMLCDVRMPGMTGIEVVARAAAQDPDLAIMILTAVNDARTATEALASGACDYLMKPVELTDLQHAVERALHKRDLSIEQRHVEWLIREEVAIRTSQLEREQVTLHTVTVGIVEALVNAMEAKDLFLRGHSQRVAELGASMAEAMELNEDTVEAVRLAGRVHDVGQIGIREAVLHKPERLTAEEFEHVKDHVRIGMEILAPLRHLGAALDYVRDHHERWDGSGYPRGLAGEAISLGGRILAAADAYDAVTSKRAYREPLTPEGTLVHLELHVGTLLDERVYRALCNVIRRRKSLVFIEE
ncbi:MAG: HD domain-containing phosphohydrolase [Gemmatimonadaceae bacterium]